MPYIKQQRRDDIWFRAYDADKASPQNAGELNYCITMHYITLDQYTEVDRFKNQLVNILNDYIKTKGVSYQTFNDIAGVVLCVQKEMLYRGHYKHLFNGILKNEFDGLYKDTIFPYEQRKCKENGDIFV